MPLAVIWALPDAGVVMLSWPEEPAGLQLVWMVQVVAGNCTGWAMVFSTLITSSWPPGFPLQL